MSALLTAYTESERGMPLVLVGIRKQGRRHILSLEGGTLTVVVPSWGHLRIWGDHPEPGGL
jgi:hypothetical protein